MRRRIRKPSRAVRRLAAPKLLPSRAATLRMTALLTRVLERTQQRILNQVDLRTIAAPEPGEISRTLESHTSSLARQDARNGLSLDFDLIQIEALKELDDPKLTAELETLAASVSTFNARGLTELVGVNVRQSTGLGAVIDRFRDTNVQLIKSLVGQQVSDVRTMLESSESSGLRVEELRKQIQDRFSVSKSRADLIARDQTLKLNADVARVRQQGAGVTRYIWTTSGDERVREEHAALEGQVFSWDDPPPPGHPGEDFQCRCTAFPVVEEFDGIDEEGNVSVNSRLEVDPEEAQTAQLSRLIPENDQAIQVDPEGMRDESLELVRRQRDQGQDMRPIEISIYPDSNGPVLTDGRHRLAVAKERGDKSILAIVRIYDSEGNTVRKLEKTIRISK